MGDDVELQTSSDDSSETSDLTDVSSSTNTPVNSVKGIKMKSLRKWNDEKFLYALDNQLISFGMRLLSPQNLLNGGMTLLSRQSNLVLRHY